MRRAEEDTSATTEADAVRREGRDAGVHDRVALDEIELYGEVLSAVAASERPLTKDEIDLVLGVAREGSPADLV